MGSEHVQEIMDKWDKLHELHLNRDSLKKQVVEIREEIDQNYDSIRGLRGNPHLTHTVMKVQEWIDIKKEKRELLKHNLEKVEDQIYVIECQMGIQLTEGEKRQ